MISWMNLIKDYCNITPMNVNQSSSHDYEIFNKAVDNVVVGNEQHHVIPMEMV